MSPWSTLCVTASLCLLLSASVIIHHGSEANSVSTIKEYEPERTSANVSYEATAPQKHARHPPEVPLEVDGYPVAPHGLSLEQVHVLVRHGERTPLSVCLSRGPAPIPQHWMLCKDAQRFRRGTRVPAVIDHGFPSGRILVERADGSVTEGECFLGELTDIGRRTSHDLGRSLRKLYVDRLSFLPDTLNHKDEVYFRSTNIARTIETLQHVIYGLYPAHKRDSGIVPDILVRSIQDENLLPNIFCERLKILRSRYAQAAAKAFNPTLEPFDHKLSWHNDGRPVRLDGKPSASDILGTVRAAIANGVTVPPEFKDKTIVDAIERAVAKHTFADETDEVRKLAMGPLLGDVTRKMLPKIDTGAKDRIKIFIYATHDVALAGLLATLDIFDDKLPAFTAFITLELFKKHKEAIATCSNVSSQSLLSTFKSEPATEYFIRLRYKNKDLALPLCSQEGKHLSGHPEFCSFSVFRDRARELTPVNHQKECSISVDS